MSQVLLHEVQIKNFRSCRDLTLDLSRFTALVGYNNAGKSNCLTAIQWLLRKKAAQEEDFFDKEKGIEVLGLLSGIDGYHLDLLAESHKKSIEKYLSEDGQLKIKRSQSVPNCKASDIKLDVWDWEKEEWSRNPTGIDNALSALMPEPIRIGAMEDAAEDVTKHKNTTTIGKLLNILTEEIYEQVKADLNPHLEKINSFFSHSGEDKYVELQDIDESVNKNIQNFFPGIGIKLHFETPTVENLFKTGTIKVFEDDGELQNFSNYGHGAQRSIQMALIQYLAEVKKEKLSTTLLLIDEPELYLHPFAIEQVREALRSLSKSGYQVVISTHSAQMITSDLASKTLLIRKEDKETKVRPRLENAVKDVVEDNRHQAEMIFSLSNSSQILFADKVILAEGKTEKRLLPSIFEAYFGKTLGQKKYALVTMEGVANTGKALKILKAMGLQAKAICDLDYTFRGAVENGLMEDLQGEVRQCKALFKEYAIQNPKIEIHHDNQLPKNGGVSAEQAYELLAQAPNIKPFIEKFHNHLKDTSNIWVWKDGAIEVSLGLDGKKEPYWFKFQEDLKEKGLEAVCANYESIKELLEWIESE